MHTNVAFVSYIPDFVAPWPYLASNHIPERNIWTSADPETLVGFTHINTYTLRPLFFNTYHNLPSCIFPFSIFMHLCYTTAIFISFTIHTKILSVWIFFPSKIRHFGRGQMAADYFTWNSPKDKTWRCWNGRRRLPPRGSQDAGSSTESQPVRFLSHLHHGLAFFHKGLSFCLCTMGTRTVPADESRDNWRCLNLKHSGGSTA